MKKKDTEWFQQDSNPNQEQKQHFDKLNLGHPWSGHSISFQMLLLLYCPNNNINNYQFLLLLFKINSVIIIIMV